MSKQTQNLSYPEQFLVRRGSLESWEQYIEDYKQKHKVDEYIVPSGQLIAVKETKEDKNYRLKLGNGVDDFYTLSYLDTDLEEKLNQEIQDRITSDEELLANDLVILNEAKQYADDLISGALKRVIVEELPTEDIDLNTIYMVLRPESEPNNIYDEYMYIDDEWEKLGSTEINLDDYYLAAEEVDELLDDKQDTLHTTGHININNNVITTEANKVYPAVMNGDNISYNVSDYPNIQFGDIAIRRIDNKFRIWVQEIEPDSSMVYWGEIEYSLQKTIQSENTPPTEAYGGYTVGDLWVQKLLGPVAQPVNYKVFVLVNIAQTPSPRALTWVDLTSGNYTSGNGIDISNNEISVDLSNNQYQLLKFDNEQLLLQTYDIAYNTNIRTSLTEGSNNPLASKSYVDNLMSGAVKRLVVQTLPTEDIDTNTIYMILKSAPTTNNIYDEWLYVGESGHETWELIGSTEVDLSNYYTKTETNTLLNAKVDKIEYTIDDLEVQSESVSGQTTITNYSSLYVDSEDIGDCELRIYYGATGYVDITNKVNTNQPINLLDIPSPSIAFMSGTPFSAFTIKAKFTNEVVHKKELAIELKKKQDTITSQNKLDADYIQDGTTNKPSVWNTVTSKVDKDETTQDFEVYGGPPYIENTIDVTNYASVTITSPTPQSASAFILGCKIALWKNDTVVDTETMILDGSAWKTIDISEYDKIGFYEENSQPSTHDTIQIKLTNEVVRERELTERLSTEIPTNVSELTNDSGYQTSSDVQTAISGKEDKTTITTDTSSTTVSLTLADNHEYRYTQDLTSLTLTMPSGDFIASVVFASGSTPTQMTYDSSIKWSGDDVTNGQFVPTEKTYNIVMWYDGINVNGIVRGV